MYNDPIFREAIRDTFVSSGGYIMCDEFFKPDMVDLLSNEIFANDLQWKIKGPVNKRFNYWSCINWLNILKFVIIFWFFRLYKYLDLKNLPFKFLFVVNMLKTNYMFQFIKDCTNVDVYGGKWKWLKRFNTTLINTFLLNHKTNIYSSCILVPENDDL